MFWCRESDPLSDTAEGYPDRPQTGAGLVSVDPGPAQRWGGERLPGLTGLDPSGIQDGRKVRIRVGIWWQLTRQTGQYVSATAWYATHKQTTRKKDLAWTP